MSLISLNEAIKKIKENTKIVQREVISIQNSLGRIAGEDIYSDRTHIAFDNSAVDGIGITQKNLDSSFPLKLKIKQEIFAGDSFQQNIALNDGECLHIMTGAFIPEEIVAVIPIENVEKISKKEVIITSKPNKMSNIRTKGEDFQQGELLITKGSYLNMQKINLLAVAGISKIKVYQKLKVAIFTSGKELIPVGENLVKGQIYDSNILLMQMFLNHLGCEVITLPTIEEKSELLITNIEKALDLKVDAILANGGASKGESDLVRSYLDNFGSIYQGIKLRPGKPSSFTKIENTNFFALPGNPMACIVSLRFLFYSFFRFSYGLQEENPIWAEIDNNYTKNKGFRFAAKGKYYLENGNAYVHFLGKQNSHLVSSFAEANAFILTAEDRDNYKNGDKVEIYPILPIIED